MNTNETEGKEQIQRVRELDKKATPGPWCWSFMGHSDNGYLVGYAEGEPGVPLTGEAGISIDLINPVLVGEHEAATCNYNDPALIAEYRTLAPALATQLERYREVIEAARKVLANAKSYAHAVPVLQDSDLKVALDGLASKLAALTPEGEARESVCSECGGTGVSTYPMGDEEYPCPSCRPSDGPCQDAGLKVKL